MAASSSPAAAGAPHRLGGRISSAQHRLGVVGLDELTWSDPARSASITCVGVAVAQRARQRPDLRAEPVERVSDTTGESARRRSP